MSEKCSPVYPCTRCKKQSTCSTVCNYRKDWERHLKKGKKGGSENVLRQSVRELRSSLSRGN